MNDDLRELLESLQSHAVEFLVIGGHAVAFHGRPRFTEDIDLFVGRSAENADRLRAALEAFGTPIGESGARQFSLKDRQMIRLGVPPFMADILNFGGSQTFEEVWASREPGELFGLSVFFPSRESLIDMKKSAGRSQDIADIENLQRP